MRWEELLGEIQGETVEHIHGAIAVSLTGYGLSVLMILAGVLVPAIFIPALGAALIFPAAFTLWAMWRTDRMIKVFAGKTALVFCVHRPRRFTIFEYDDELSTRMLIRAAMSWRR